MLEALTNFHFLRPGMLWALLPLALAALLLLRRRLAHGAWRRAVDPELAPWIVESSWSRTGRGLLAGAMLAWLIAVLALAGPSWEQRPQPVSRGGDAIVIVLDMTLSMYAADLAPSRIARARLKIADILDERRDGQTGMVVYAGDSHVVVPLTDDARTITNLLGSLEPRIMPQFGNRPDRAIEQANRLFVDAAMPRGRIILLTDGIREPERLLASVDDRYPVSVLGIGTEAGAPIPLEPLNREGYLRAEGNVVVAHLDEDVLRGFARAAGGSYARFAPDGSDLESLLPNSADGRGAGTNPQRELQMWIDAGPWLVLLLIPMALFAFRRGVLAAPVFALILLPPDAEAFSWRDLFQRPDQQAHAALRAGQPERAVERFEDPAWRATALYRSEHYDQAAREFRGEDALSHYNRGTALARAERFEEALEQLEQAVELDPDFEDARHNRDLVERILEQDRPDAANEQASQRDNPSWDDDDEGSAVSRRGDNGDPQQSQRDPRPGEDGAQREGEQTEDPESQSGRDNEPDPSMQAESERDAFVDEREREQALEQWLRRVADDPGALLQRKFRYEADRRRREGSFDPNEAGQPW